MPASAKAAPPWRNWRSALHPASRVALRNPTLPESGSRRGFLKTLGGIGAGIAALPTLANAQPARPSSATYMGDFAAPKLDKVRCAFIDVGYPTESTGKRMIPIIRPGNVLFPKLPARLFVLPLEDLPATRRQLAHKSALSHRLP